MVVNVAAKTKNGEALPGLKAADFIVTEDGKPQQIKVFEYQRLQDEVAGAARRCGAVRERGGRGSAEGEIGRRSPRPSRRR